MLDPIHDECGIAAIYRLDPGASGIEPDGEVFTGSVTPMMPDLLIDLQNRGQLAAGLTRYQEDAEQLIDTYKDVGSVSDVFKLTHPDETKFKTIVDDYAGRALIGHVRYATCGKEEREFAQPFERHHGRIWKWFAFCFNGNIANYAEVRDNLLEKGDYHLAHDTDTEVMMHHLAFGFKGNVRPDLKGVFEHLAKTVDGAFSLAFLNAAGDMVVARDPLGIRPLVYGTKGNLFAAASESLALVNQGFTNVRDLEPGHMIHVRPEGIRVEQFVETKRKAHCFFEWVYFANVASKINDRSVYVARTRLGEALAEVETVDANPDDCVAVPVPDTAKAACDALAHRLGIPTREGLIRNRYVGRTFIEGKSRKEKAKRKYTALPEVLDGKRVFLVEDSIVRSTTMRVIVRMLRDYGGAKEVHVRVACPPIMAPCSYGIDMSTVSELIAPKFFEKPQFETLDADGQRRLAGELGADSLRYLTVDQLTRAIDLPESDLCLGCLLGKYPSKWGQDLYAVALDEKDNVGDGKRTYERRKKTRRVLQDRRGGTPEARLSKPGGELA